VGMGASLVARSEAAARVHAEADEALPGLSSMVQDGPASRLNETRWTQPAILAHSIAVWKSVLADDALPERPDYVLGHSLGEFSALVAAGALPFADALSIVHRRGEAMQDAVPRGQGMMAALMPMSHARAQDLLDAWADAEFEDPHSAARVVSIANVNSPSQVVISGKAQAVQDVIDLAKSSFGVRRATKLPVSAPFHCELMAPAATAVRAMLEALPGGLCAPAMPIVSNIDAHPRAAGGSELVDALVAQTTSSVLWYPSLEWLVDPAGGNVDTFVLIGPGTATLASFLRPLMAARTAAGGPELRVLEFE